LGVYRIRGLQAEKISNPQIDTIIGTVNATNASFYANSFRLGGYPYLGISISSASESAEDLLLENADFLLLENGDNILLETTPAQEASFVRFIAFNASLGIWSEWDSAKCTFIDSVGSGSTNQLIATSRYDTDGNIYTINPTANGELYQDDGDAYSMEIRTSKINFGTNVRKFYSEVSLIGHNIQSSGTGTLEYSDDDYATWTTAGTFDLTQANPKITSCGSHQGGRAWRVTDSGNNAFHAQALKFDFTLGSH
jgi:hypothetical protein